MHIFLFLLSLFSASLISAQVTARITYEDIRDMHRNIPPEKEDLKHMIPQFNSSKWELILSGDESIYQRIVETEINNPDPGRGGMYMRFGRENRILYKNLATDIMVDSREFMQKQFLIKGPPTPHKWKVGPGNKEILGNICMKAFCQVDSVTKMTAWFTPVITSPNGPLDYHALPGLILQIDINDGERTITATEIKLNDPNIPVITAPTKGKEVTFDEFEKIREEKMKEMQLQQSSSGNMIYTRRHN